MHSRRRTVILDAASPKRLDGPNRCSAEDGFSGNKMAMKVEETTK